MVSGEKVLTCLNRVKLLTSDIKSMGVSIYIKELAMNDLNVLPKHFEPLLVTLDTMESDDLFTFY